MRRLLVSLVVVSGLLAGTGGIASAGSPPAKGVAPAVTNFVPGPTIPGGNSLGPTGKGSFLTDTAAPGLGNAATGQGQASKGTASTIAAGADEASEGGITRVQYATE